MPSPQPQPVRPYDVVAPAMLLERHELGIHVVCSVTSDVTVADVRLRRSRASTGPADRVLWQHEMPNPRENPSLAVSA
jgi:hypothetical protein